MLRKYMAGKVASIASGAKRAYCELERSDDEQSILKLSETNWLNAAMKQSQTIASQARQLQA
jgi:hypothetical protein